MEVVCTVAAQLLKKELCVGRRGGIDFSKVLAVVMRFVAHGNCVGEGSLWSAITVQERYVQLSSVENL